MATASVEQTPASELVIHEGVEFALFYLEAALEAHRDSFGPDAAKNAKLQWGVTGLLERAIQILRNDQYGEG